MKLFKKFLLMILKGKLVVLKSDVCLYCPKGCDDLEDSLLFDLDTMIQKISYFMEG